MRSLVLNTPGKPRQVKEVGHQQWMHAMYVNLSVQVIYVNARRTFALHQASSWRLLAKESNLSTQKLGCVLSEMVSTTCAMSMSFPHYRGHNHSMSNLVNLGILCNPVVNSTCDKRSSANDKQFLPPKIRSSLNKVSPYLSLNSVAVVKIVFAATSSPPSILMRDPTGIRIVTPFSS